jgi:predicted amidohydrolase YtcJ
VGRYYFLILSALALAACVGHEQEFVRSLAAPSFADWILSSGKILTLNQAGESAEALAVKDGFIVAVGSDGEMRRWRGPNTREINLGRRTVIPGLNDAHIPATAAGLTWNYELHWQGLRSLSEAMQQIAAAARGKPAGSWIVVAGGWLPSQFTETRLPTRAELDTVAPRHPVYLQILDQAALLNSAAMNALGITRETRDPPAGRFERDAKTGEMTGYALGAGAWQPVYAKIPRPPFAGARQSLRGFFRELNRLGITSVSDVHDGNVDFGHRRLLNDMARSGELSVRVNFYIAPQQPANQIQQYKRALAEVAQLKQTEMFRFAGFVVPPPDGSEGDLTRADASPHSRAGSENTLSAAAEFFAAGDYRFRLYAAHEEQARQMLNLLESLAGQFPSPALRISLTSMEAVSPETVARLKKIGAGIVVHSRLASLGQTLGQFRRAEQMPNAPPLRTILDNGVPLAAGTIVRGSSYSPMLGLWSLVTGNSIAGTRMRDPGQNLTRVEALRAYTQGAARFTGDDTRKGSIEPGKLADLAVLNEDYLTVPLDRIPELESLLTMVAGRVVYAAGPFARFQQR